MRRKVLNFIKSGNRHRLDLYRKFYNMITWQDLSNVIKTLKKENLIVEVNHRFSIVVKE